MDLAPRALARWLPWLPAALGIEGIVALTPPFTGSDVEFFSCLAALVHVPEIALLLGFAIGIFVMTSGGATRLACQRLLYGGFAAIGVTSLARFMDVSVDSGTALLWLFLHIGANLLFAVAAPGLWGAALAWEQDLSSARIARLSRIFAGIAFAGAGVFGLSEVAGLLRQNPLEALKETGVGPAFASFVLLAGRLLLVWCAVDFWKKLEDVGAIRDRARSVQRRMIGAAIVVGGSALFTAFFWRMESHRGGRRVDVPMIIWGGPGWVDQPMVLWHGVVQLTLTLLVTILLALALENETQSFNPRKKGPFFPEPPPPPPPADVGPIDVP